MLKEPESAVEEFGMKEENVVLMRYVLEIGSVIITSARQLFVQTVILNAEDHVNKL